MLTNFSVYKPGNVKLHPELLGKHQKYVKDAIGAKEDKPVFLVFHGGSGSSKQEFLPVSETVSQHHILLFLQVPRSIIDVRLYATNNYWSRIHVDVLNKKDYLMAQVGNPDGEDKPNKKYFDPRKFSRLCWNAIPNGIQVSGFVREKRPCLLVLLRV